MNDTFYLEIQSICNQLMKTLKEKNNDYGNAFDQTYNRFGDTMVAVRLYDKLNRFISLTVDGQGQQVLTEPVEDTLLDLAGYAILAIRKRRETYLISELE